MPPAFGAQLLLHTRGASALPAEEVTWAGDCTGAASQAAGKLQQGSCSREAASPTATLVWEGTGHGNGAEAPIRALGDGERAGEILALLKSVLALPALPPRTQKYGGLILCN